MYRISSGEGVEWIVWNEQKSERIPLDPDDQRFCDFLTWASRADAPDLKRQFGLQGRARFFADAVRFTEYYKTSGDTLAAKPCEAGHDGRWELLTGGACHETGHSGKFHNVCKAVALVEKGQDGVGGIFSKASKTWISSRLLDQLNALLAHEDAAVRRLSTWPIERSFVYIDVSDFSQYPPGQQCLIVNSLVRTVQVLSQSKVSEIRTSAENREASLCIGDGYIYVFRDSRAAAIFAASLAYLIELLVARKALPVSYHFRMSVHSGPVYSFWDPGRNDWNYIGDGINGGNRVLGAIGKDVDDVLFISAHIKQHLTAQTDGSRVHSSILNSLQNRGRRTDKHGNSWRVYEVNHTSAISSYFVDLVTTLSSS
jgi:hypothetical protein